MAGALIVASCTSEPAAAPRPNVLLVSIDTLRADHLSSYGYERETSPNLDALARRGARFERTFSTTSWTLPSHMSMLTGLPISAHGICDDRLWSLTDDAGSPAPVEQIGVFIPEVLKDEGYRTGGFYTWQYVDQRYGFGPGFETFERWGHTFYSDEAVSAEWNRLREAGDKPGIEALQARHPELFDPAHMSSPETIGRALEWIDEVKADTPDAPFFAFVHLFDVHDPYTPPAPFDTKFDPDYTGTIDGKNITAANSPFVRDMPKADFDHVVALYDGGISSRTPSSWSRPTTARSSSNMGIRPTARLYSPRACMSPGSWHGPDKSARVWRSAAQPASSTSLPRSMGCLDWMRPTAPWAVTWHLS